MTQETPEQGYKENVSPTERKRIRAAVVEAYRPQVAALVRKLVPTHHGEEGLQVGLIGVLVALEKYDAPRCTKVGGDRGAAFWNFARTYVRDEIRTWLGVGVYWRKAPNRGKSAARRAAAKEARRHMTQESMDEVVVSTPNESTKTRHDLIADASPTVEAQVAEAEAFGRLSAFAATLTPKEKQILFSDRSNESRHHLSLTERAKAFVRGKDDGKAVERCSARGEASGHRK